jgi:hypothetical protein
MSKIPKEYLTTGWDFGFTTVDEPDDNTPPPPQPVVQQVDTSPILDRLQNMESSLEQVMNILGRFEQASTPNFDTDEYKQLIEKDVKEKLTKIEGLIIPLLVNLMKNPEKDYIHWPNRSPLIEAQIQKILDITRDESSY